jgi:predicted dehydrogenase
MQARQKNANTAKKIAIVGCGAITESAHLPAALRSSLIEVTALVDSNINNAAALARRYALHCPICKDLNEVVENVDGVIIATPNSTHFYLGEIALSRGVPVLIEKPLTTKYADSVRLCSMAEKNNTFISVGYVSRYYPSILLMKKLLQSKFFGEIRSFHYEFGSMGGWEPISGYNIHRSMAGGGTLVITGTHFLDRMLYWFGEPKEFTYEDDNYGGVEANCKARLLFENDLGKFSGTFFMSKTISLRNKFIIDCEKYVCELDEFQKQSLTLFPKENSSLKIELTSRETNKHNDVDYFQVQLESFVKQIQNKGCIKVDGWFGARSVKLIEEMYKKRSPLSESWSTHWKI